MADDDSNQKDNKKKSGGNGFNNIPVFTLLAWAAIIAATVGLFMVKKNFTAPAAQLSQADFLNKFASNQIVHASINFNAQSSPLTPISGEFLETGKDGLVSLLDRVDYRTDEVFGFEVPVEVPGVEGKLLDPRSTWRDPDAYDRKAHELAEMFRANFEQFSSELATAGPLG